VNKFIEFYQILLAVIPFEIVVIVLAGIVFYIIEVLKGEKNVENKKVTK
jgi:hypothetical protein